MGWLEYYDFRDKRIYFRTNKKSLPSLTTTGFLIRFDLSSKFRPDLQKELDCELACAAQSTSTRDHRGANGPSLPRCSHRSLPPPQPISRFAFHFVLCLVYPIRELELAGAAENTRRDARTTTLIDPQFQHPHHLDFSPSSPRSFIECFFLEIPARYLRYCSLSRSFRFGHWLVTRYHHHRGPTSDG